MEKVSIDLFYKFLFIVLSYFLNGMNELKTAISKRYLFYIYLAVCNTHDSHNHKVVWGRPCSFIKFHQ
jgi:hypothetical protein